MDSVGPVEKSRAGHRFMLVISDCATKYPKVFPLRNIGAKQVASCLIQLFSRVGFPRDILWNQFYFKAFKASLSVVGSKGFEVYAIPSTNRWVGRKV